MNATQKTQTLYPEEGDTVFTKNREVRQRDAVFFALHTVQVTGGLVSRAGSLRDQVISRTVSSLVG
jgi:hypothetical protein